MWRKSTKRAVICTLAITLVLFGTMNNIIAYYEPSGKLDQIEPFNPEILARWSDKNEDGILHSKMVLSQNFIYLAGTTFSSQTGIPVPYLIKYDMKGTLIWNNSLFQKRNNYTYALDVFNNSIYLVLKDVYNRGIAISQFDENGTHLSDSAWLGETDPIIYGLMHVGDFLYAAGTTSGNNGKVMLLKIDRSGTVIDEYTWGLSEGHLAHSLTSDGKYIYMTGRTNCKGNNTTLILKYDLNGSLIWERRWGDNYGICPAGNAISMVGNNIYIVGYSDKQYPLSRLTLLKYDLDGNLVWSKITRYSFFDKEGYDISIFNSSLFSAIPCTKNTGAFHTCIFKYDLDGNLKWMKVGDYPIPGISGGIISVFALNEWEYYVAASLKYEDVNVYLTLMKGLIPTMPLNFIALGDYNGINLKWDLPTDANGENYLEHKLYRNLTSGNFSLYKNISGDIFNYTDSNVARGVKYCYVISAIAAGHEGEKSKPACGVRYPSPPRNLKAVSVGYKMVMLQWEPPFFIGKYTVIGYNIYRSTSPGNGSLYRGIDNITSFVDLNVSIGMTYFYRVTAIIDAGIESGFSNEANTTPSFGGTVSSPPQSLKAYLNNHTIKLTWSPPVADGGYDLIEYRIYRWIIPPGKKLTAVLSGVITSYSDFNIDVDTTYHYHVTAMNLIGESNSSNEAIVTVPPNPPNNQSSIKGMVVDETKKVISNATILLYYQVNHTIIKMTFTNVTGRFLITSVFEGDYNLRIEAEGYETMTMDDIFIGQNETKDIGIIILKKKIEPVSDSNTEWLIIIVLICILILLTLTTLWLCRKNSLPRKSTIKKKNEKDNLLSRFQNKNK